MSNGAETSQRVNYRDGRETTVTYYPDGKGVATLVDTSPNGTVKTFFYAQNTGNPTGLNITDAKGNVIRAAPDPDNKGGFVSQATGKHGETIVTHYDGGGNLTSTTETDKHGHTITTNYDPTTGKVVSQTKGQGGKMTFGQGTQGVTSGTQGTSGEGSKGKHKVQDDYIDKINPSGGSTKNYNFPSSHGMNFSFPSSPGTSFNMPSGHGKH